MKYDKVLEKVENGELNPEEALETLYKKSLPRIGRRASFIKMNIHVPEEGAKVNTFLKILFLLPMPIILAKVGLRIASKRVDLDQDIDLKEIAKYITYSKGTRVSIDTEEAKVEIKIF
jgi:hypothetical protein